MEILHRDVFRYRMAVFVSSILPSIVTDHAPLCPWRIFLSHPYSRDCYSNSLMKTLLQESIHATYWMKFQLFLVVTCLGRRPISYIHWSTGCLIGCWLIAYFETTASLRHVYLITSTPFTILFKYEVTLY